MKIFLILIAITFSVAVNSLPACHGKVKSVMEREGQCDGNIAYFTNTYWFCSMSEKSGAIILAAYAAGKTIESVFPDDLEGVEACSQISTHFLTPWSIRTTD